MSARKCQTTDDVIARAAGQAPAEPRVPFARFRSTWWIIFWIVIANVAVGAVAVALGLF